MKKAYPYIIVVLVIALAIVSYIRFYPTKPAANITGNMTTPETTQTAAVAPVKPTVAVAGMQKYTDTTLGYSFWYPTTWQVTVPTNPPFGAQLTGGTVVETLALEPIGQAYPSIMIKGFHSSTTSITDTGGAGPIGPITFFFDSSTHTWMTSSSIADGVTAITKPANISNNSMGGLHLFGGTSRFDTNIIPLSAKNFVGINDGGASNATVVAATVVASDPAVATPVSASQQVQTIQTEQQTLASESSQ
jgi:hypothetical protein